MSATFFQVLSCCVGDVLVTGSFDNGFLNCAKPSYKIHNHLHYELHIPTGQSYVLQQIDQTMVEVPPQGIAILIPPGCYHKNADVRDGEMCRYVMRLDFTQGESVGEASLFSLFSAFLQRENGKMLLVYIQDAVELSSRIQECFLSPSVCSHAVAEACFKMLMTHFVQAALSEESLLCKGREQEENNADSDFSRRVAIEHVMGELLGDPNFNTEQLAERVHLSVRQTQRTVAKFYGDTFHRVLTDFRLNTAYDLMLSTEDSVEQIASRVGYANPSAFYPAFKAKYGISPNALRQTKKTNV